MSVTNNLTLIHACDALTDATTSNVLSGTGSPTIKTYAADEITPRQGTGCYGVDLDVETLYFNIAKGSGSWNLTNSTIYAWFAFLTPTYLDTWQNGGVLCELRDASSNYSRWYLSGSDIALSDWSRYCFSTSTTPDAVSGTLSISAVTNIRFYFTGATKSKLAENVLMDFVHYAADGTGITVTGGSSGTPETMADVFGDDDAADIGIVQRYNGVYFLNGPVQFGDSSGTGDTYFAGASQLVSTIGRYRTFTTTYRTSAETLLASSHFNVTVAGNSTGTTSFTLGSVTGTAGYNGLTFSSLASAAKINFLIGNAYVDTLGLYGCVFVGCGTFTFVNDSSHLIYSCSFIACKQIDPVGGPVFRNCLFVSTVDTDSALLWNASANVQSCSFIANTTGAAIEHPSSGAFGYTSLTFSGNTYDILNSISAGTLVDSNDAGSSGKSLNDVTSAVSQSFTGTAGRLSMVRVRMVKVGSATGNAVAKLYAHSGTYGTSSVPTGAALAESEAVDVSGIGGSYEDVEFDFGDRYLLSASTYYCIVIEYNDGTSSDYVNIQYDSSGAHGGNQAAYTTSWSAESTNDLRFLLYRDGEVVINATDSNPATYEESGTNTTTVIYSSVDITITVQDANKDPIENAQTSVFLLDAPHTQLMNEDTNALGVATEAYGGAVPVDVVVKVRKSEDTDDPRYFAHSSVQEISTDGLTLLVTLEVNPFI